MDDENDGHFDCTLPDGYRVRVYDFGGLDVQDDRGAWITIASNVESCAVLAKLAQAAADVGEKAEG